MKFYTSIAPYYDQIFPYQPVQKTFVESFQRHGSQSTLLDVGCGTGSLALNLADSFGTVIGLDPDKEMLDLARIKALKHKFDRQSQLEDLGTWVFLQKGMLDLKLEFAPESFDVVLCLGNTLVHLNSLEEVRDFLKQAYEITRSKGLLLIQIINYDRIIEQEMRGLPTLENEKIKFERVYHYDSSPETIQFQTKLTVKETNETIENEVALLALRPALLRELLLEAGFKDLMEFGNFKKEAFGKDSQPYVVGSRK